MQRQLLSLLAFAVLFLTPWLRAGEAPIVHSVFFKLKYEKGSAGEKAFYQKIMRLARIPGVEDFQWLKEVSPKNGFDYGLRMRFANQAAYEGYSKHPDHVAFVEIVWLSNVADFMEIDYVEGTSLPAD